MSDRIGEGSIGGPAFDWCLWGHSDAELGFFMRCLDVDFDCTALRR